MSYGDYGYPNNFNSYGNEYPDYNNGNDYSTDPPVTDPPATDLPETDLSASTLSTTTTLDPIAASEEAALSEILERIKTMKTPVGEPEVEPETLHPSFYNPEGEPENRPYPEGEGEPFPEGEAEPGVYPEPFAPLFADREGKSVYSTLAAVVATLIVILNIAVLVVLARKPKQRKSLSYLIGLIAAFDMLGGLQFLWFSSFDIQLMLTHQGMWIIVMCGIWMLTMAPQIAALLHFGLHLLDELSVGVNNAKISLARILFIVLTVFLLPIALFIPPVAGWNCIGCRTDTNPENYCAKKCSMAIFPFTKNYVLLMVILLFAAVLAVVSIYGTIYYKICAKRCQRRLSPKSGNSNVIRLTTSLLTVYILCTLPVGIVMLFDYIQWEYNADLITAFHATLFVSFLSNLINPIIVFCSLPPMRETKWEDCCKKAKATNDQELSNSSASGSVNKSYSSEKKVPLDEEEAAATKI